MPPMLFYKRNKTDTVNDGVGFISKNFETLLSPSGMPSFGIPF